jgi:hypothetical protein
MECDSHFFFRVVPEFIYLPATVLKYWTLTQFPYLYMLPLATKSARHIIDFFSVYNSCVYFRRAVLRYAWSFICSTRDCLISCVAILKYAWLSICIVVVYIFVFKPVPYFKKIGSCRVALDDVWSLLGCVALRRHFWGTSFLDSKQSKKSKLRKVGSV